MNLLHGPAISNLCDYDFGDQAGCLGGVEGAFMEEANEGNVHFIQRIKDSGVMTLFIDNIRLYKRPLKAGTPHDQERVNHLMEKNDLMHLLAEILLFKPHTEFIIFCNNEDTPITEDIQDKIPPNVRAIYAANAIGYGGKLHPFPYGLGRPLVKGCTKHDLLKISMREERKPRKLLYVNHAEHTNLSERGNIREMFKDKSYATVDERVSYIEYVNQIKDHKFMICPEGNAVDCHRNWEVLCLKRVPIMKMNRYLAECYKEYPILWVEDFAKINKSSFSANKVLFILAKSSTHKIGYSL